jgi:hypothetical protein
MSRITLSNQWHEFRENPAGECTNLRAPHAVCEAKKQFRIRPNETVELCLRQELTVEHKTPKEGGQPGNPPGLNMAADGKAKNAAVQGQSFDVVQHIEQGTRHAGCPAHPGELEREARAQWGVKRKKSPRTDISPLKRRKFRKKRMRTLGQGVRGLKLLGVQADRKAQIGNWEMNKRIE